MQRPVALTVRGTLAVLLYTIQFAILGVRSKIQYCDASEICLHTQPVSHGPHSALVVLKERKLACSPQTTQNTDRRRHVACECVTGNESTLGTSLKSRSWLVLRHKDARVKIRAGVDINPTKYSATSWSLPHTYCYQPFKPPRKIHKNLIIECHLNQNGVVYLISTVPNPIWMAQYRSWNQNRGGTSRNLYRRDTAFQYSGYLLQMSSDFSVVYASEIALPLSDVSLCCCAGGSVRRKDGGFICFVEPVGVLYIEPFFLLILNFGVKHDIYMLLFFR